MIDLNDFNNYLLQIGASRTDTKRYTQVAREFLASTDVPLDKITDSDVLEYVNCRENPKDLLRAIQHLDRFLFKSKITTQHFAQHLRKKNGPAHFSNCLEPSDYQKILNSFDSFDLEEKVLIGILLFSDSGPRADETINLKVKDLIEEVPIIHHAKGQKKRNLILPTSVKKLIIEYIEEKKMSPEDYLFTHNGRRISQSRFRRIFNSAMQKAGTTHLTPHDMRRLSISKTLENGRDAEEIKFAAGHDKKEVTLRYLSTNYVAKKIKERDTLYTFEKGGSDEF